jgi:hypothetical protein
MSGITTQERPDLGPRPVDHWGLRVLGIREVHRGREGTNDARSCFINGLRKKGYSDSEIVFYGDSRDGRHLYDATGGSGVVTYGKASECFEKHAAKPTGVKTYTGYSLADRETVVETLGETGEVNPGK